MAEILFLIVLFIVLIFMVFILYKIKNSKKENIYTNDKLEGIVNIGIVEKDIEEPKRFMIYGYKSDGSSILLDNNAYTVDDVFEVVAKLYK